MDKKGLAKSIEPFFEKVEKLSKVQRILISAGFFHTACRSFHLLLFLAQI